MRSRKGTCRSVVGWDGRASRGLGSGVWIATIVVLSLAALGLGAGGRQAFSHSDFLSSGCMYVLVFSALMAVYT